MNVVRLVELQAAPREFSGGYACKESARGAYAATWKECVEKCRKENRRRREIERETGMTTLKALECGTPPDLLY